jgi:hypothetical protein
MSRVIQELDDVRGTELITCKNGDCGRGVVVQGPEDLDVLAELVDDFGWTYARGWFCPTHGGWGAARLQDFVRTQEVR